MDYQALKTLIETHPSWPSVDDETLTTWVNEEAISATKTSLPNEEILAVILGNRADFAALSDTDKQLIRDIVYVGDSVPTETGNPTRDAFVAIYAGKTDTLQALAAAIAYQISRAANVGILGQVRNPDVAYARTI